jgi:GTP-binding protein EngB required for normal cell division
LGTEWRREWWFIRLTQNAMGDARQNSPRTDANPLTPRNASARRAADGSFSNPFRVAIAGNPNSGKTTLFNALTKSRLRTGNYSGVTVERAEGRIRWGPDWFEFVDLPGTFSLSTELLKECRERGGA